MTKNEEIASIKDGLATELHDCLGDHLKLQRVADRLHAEARALRDHEKLNPAIGPDIRAGEENLPKDKQAVAEMPAYRLGGDDDASKALPIAKSNPETLAVIEDHKRGIRDSRHVEKPIAVGKSRKEK